MHNLLVAKLCEERGWSSSVRSTARMGSGSDSDSSSVESRRRSKRARKSTASGLGVKTRVTNNLGEVKKQLDDLRQARGNNVLTREERLDILFVYFGVCQDGLEKRARTGRKVPINAQQTTANLLGRSVATVSAVVKGWTDAIAEKQLPCDAVEMRANRGNRQAKVTRVPNTREMYVKVRNFVREERMNHKRVTAAQVMEFLIEDKVLDVEVGQGNIIPPKPYNAAIKATRRFLSRNGFLRHKLGSVKVKPIVIEQRDAYVRVLMQNRTLPENARRREVYLDESYIHQHYTRHEYSVHDPKDGEDKTTKLPAKGRRYCILAAIQGRGANNAPSGLVPNSVWMFCPQSRKESAGDYHKNFNGKNFSAWWRNQLLPNLTQPSIIIMDNAKYHLSKPPDTPDPIKWKKAEILTFLTERGESVDSNVSAVEAKGLMRRWINSHVKAEVVQLAEAAGHTVLFTPPHYSDLQPIELVWAHIKGNVGRQYSKGTTLAQVKSRLDGEFERLNSEEGNVVIDKIISHVDGIVGKILNEIQINDEQDASEGFSHSDSSSSASTGGRESSDSSSSFSSAPPSLPDLFTVLK